MRRRGENWDIYVALFLFSPLIIGVLALVLHLFLAIASIFPESIQFIVVLLLINAMFFTYFVIREKRKERKRQRSEAIYE